MIRCTRGRKCLGATLLPCWQGLRVCTLQIRFQHTHTCEPHINQTQYCYALRVHAHHFFYYHTRYAKAATATCSSAHRRLPLDQQGTFDAACTLVAAVLPRGHCCPTPAEVLLLHGHPTARGGWRVRERLLRVLWQPLRGGRVPNVRHGAAR